MNRQRPLMIAALLLLMSCRAEESQAPAPAPTPDADLTPALAASGWGSLKIGMTHEEVVAATGDDAHPELVGGPDPEQCDEFRPVRAPEGMRVMIQQGVLTRISVSGEADVKTDDGFSVGDPASAIRDALGDRIEASAHPYQSAPAEHLLVWDDGSPDVDPRGKVYEIGLDGNVASIHAGGRSIQSVEGCV